MRSVPRSPATRVLRLDLADADARARTRHLGREGRLLLPEASWRDSGERAGSERALGGTAGGTTTRKRGPTVACVDPQTHRCPKALPRGYLAAQDGKTAVSSGEGGIRTPDGRKRPYRFSRPAHSTALPPLRSTSTLADCPPRGRIACKCEESARFNAPATRGLREVSAGQRNSPFQARRSLAGPYAARSFALQPSATSGCGNRCERPRFMAGGVVSGVSGGARQPLAPGLAG